LLLLLLKSRLADKKERQLMSNKATLLLMADAHLAVQTWKTYSAYGDSFVSFSAAIDIAINKGVDSIICAGDLFDETRNSSEPIVFFKKELDRLGLASPAAFYYVQGQHEMQKTPWASIAHNAVHLHEKTIEVGGMCIRGLDYQPTAKLKEALAAVPANVDILVAHQVWADLMGTHLPSQASAADVHHARHLWTGDFHDVVQRTVTRADGQPISILSPGSMCMQAINERTDKYVHIVTIEDGKILGTQRIQLPTRRLFDAGLLCNAADITEAVRQIDQFVVDRRNTVFDDRICSPLIRVSYKRALLTDGVVDKLRAVTKDRAHLFLTELSDAVPDQPPDYGGAQVTLSGAITEYMNQNELAHLNELAVDLLNAPVAGPVIERYVRHEAASS
jgi:predicted phosphodiesterase